MQQTEREAEPMHLEAEVNTVSAGATRDELAPEGGMVTDREEPVALSARAVHLDPVKRELLNLADRYVCPHKPGYHGVHREEQLREGENKGMVTRSASVKRLSMDLELHARPRGQCEYATGPAAATLLTAKPTRVAIEPD